MPYTVSRQLQWPEGTAVVEVSKGGLDYTNPDALSPKYSGEFETYDSPVEAVETAIAICRAWRKDGRPEAMVGMGATLGMTIPFEPTTFREGREWAKRELARLPKCDRCGDLLPERSYWVPELDGEKFCSEYCTEEAWAEACRQDN